MTTVQANKLVKLRPPQEKLAHQSGHYRMDWITGLGTGNVGDGGDLLWGSLHFKSDRENALINEGNSSKRGNCR